MDDFVCFMNVLNLQNPQSLFKTNAGRPITCPLSVYSDCLARTARMAAPGNNSLLIADEDDDDDIVIMNRQIAKISRHVLLLEDENAKRSQREAVLYPVVFGYLLFRIAAWFLRRV